MRSLSIGAAAALTLLASACSQRADSTATSNDEFKKDLAAASIGSSALATSPSKYERLRFVSSIEMSRATEKAPRPKPSVHHEQMAPAPKDGLESHGVATEEVTTVVAEAPVPAAAAAAISSGPSPSETMMEEPIATAGRSTSATPTVQGPANSDGVGGRFGRIFGAIMSNVVIRGGHGDDDKCDPRGAARARGRGPITLAMPMGVGGSTSFPAHVYR